MGPVLPMSVIFLEKLSEQMSQSGCNSCFICLWIMASFNLIFLLQLTSAGDVITFHFLRDLAVISSC